MDRLHLVAVVVCVALLSSACDDGEGESPKAESESSGRVNAVQADPDPPPPPKAFCDKYFEGSEASTFEFPKLRGDAPPSSEGWRWVNVWATWCKPCIEEMPRLVQWREKLSDDGLGGLVLVSVDESREKVETFRKKHPKTPESLLISKPEAVKPWVKSLGLSSGAPLPVHVFVDSKDRVRCLRAGGIGEDEFGAVERLIGS